MWIYRKLLFTVRNFKKTAYHHYGPSPLSFIRLIYYGLFRINTFLVYVKELDGAIGEVVEDGNLKIITPSLAELDRIRQGKELPREFYCDRIYQAKQCYVGLYRGQLAYIHWMYMKGDYSRFLLLDEGICEINHVTTLPGFKGRKLSSKILAHALKSLGSHGCKKVAVVVHQNNVAFIKSICHLEFVERRRVVTIGPFNRKVTV